MLWQLSMHRTVCGGQAVNFEDCQLEALRFRNAQLRLLLLQREEAIARLQQQIANWQQTAIAALAKAEQLEQGQ